MRWLLVILLGSGIPTAIPVAGDLFEDATEATGLDVVHFNGRTGELYLPEITGSGLALFDYDGDGDLDLYVVQGNLLGPEATAERALDAVPRELPLSDRLLRADRGPDGALRWVDVTRQARISCTGYGMAAAVGDVDSDGWPDVYVANLGPNCLLRNRGDGTFEDRTTAAGVDDDRWSTAALFFDADGDGDEDLYVGNYVDFAFVRHRQCTTVTGAPDYCGPLAYSPETDRFFVGRGDGTFADASATSGLGKAPGNTLGAVVLDADGDGSLDLYVANDQMENFLWMNDGGGVFTDNALFAGAALNMEGLAEASMGIEAGDVDGDGAEDLFMTHLGSETNTLYLNDGRGLFRDASMPSGLGAPSWERTGFGAGLLDFDNDGLLDVLVVNGAVRTIGRLAAAGDPFPFHEPNQLFRNEGGGRFSDVTDRAGAAFERSEVGRGLALGDVDGDGAIDAVLSNNNGPVRLLLNRAAAGSHWLGVAVERASGAAALGTGVEIGVVGGETLFRRVRTGGSYASSSDPRVLAGLGAAVGPVRLRVTWPDGGIREIHGLPADRSVVVRP